MALVEAPPLTQLNLQSVVPSFVDSQVLLEAPFEERCDALERYLRPEAMGRLSGLLDLEIPLQTMMEESLGDEGPASFNEFVEVSREVEGLLSSLRKVDLWHEGTGAHEDSVMNRSVEFAEALELDEIFVGRLAFTALFHDLGKHLIVDELIDKPDALSADEWSIMEQHPELGARLLWKHEWARFGVAGVLSHHMGFDGNGYPDLGLAGKRIPLAGRILKIVDCYDALRQKREYRSDGEGQGHAFSKSKAMTIMGENRQEFDPLLLRDFFAVLAERFRQEGDADSASIAVSSPRGEMLPLAI